ncbi:ion channel [Caldalkalibacillus salinus]|uniref:ion channel n=1 Tax=Caldalkalibacillus salinus TaxID=2803787 RepID=UPI001922390C
MFELMKQAVKVKNRRLILMAIVFFVFSAYFLHYLEPEMFNTPFIAFWYVMTTVTTTGYGDFVPETTIGKIYTLILYLVGIGLIGIILGKIVEFFELRRKWKEEGRLQFRGKSQFVVVGWSKKAKTTIYEILISKEEAHIVLIDTKNRSPVSHPRIHYIQGDATEVKTLEKASVLDAEAVLVFASDPVTDEVSADGRSLLIVSSIESYARKEGRQIYTIVEIIREKHIPNFKHANVDEFVLSNEAFSDLMAKSALHKGSTRLFMQLLSHKHGVNLWEIRRDPEWYTYHDAFEALKNMGANLISDHHDFTIIQRLDEPIPDDAQLYVICDDATYRRLKDDIKIS